VIRENKARTIHTLRKSPQDTALTQPATTPDLSPGLTDLLFASGISDRSQSDLYSVRKILSQVAAPESDDDRLRQYTSMRGVAQQNSTHIPPPPHTHRKEKAHHHKEIRLSRAFVPCAGRILWVCSRALELIMWQGCRRVQHSGVEKPSPPWGGGCSALFLTD